MQTNLDRSSEAVKPKNSEHEPLIATALVAVIIKRGDGRHPQEELFFVPVCAGCGRAILDFDAANVVVVGGESDAPLESLGTLDTGEAHRLPGTALAFHHACDVSGGKPWNRVANILRFNQRGGLMAEVTP